jgi:sugar lactone lactonase YvrE
VSSVISALRPGWAVPGAVVSIEGRDLPVPADGPPGVTVGSLPAHVTLASPERIRLVVPAEAEGGSAAVRLDALPGETVFLEIARTLTTGIQQVDSPAFDSAGRLHFTMSGSRGARHPVPLFRIDREGTREPLSVEIGNPTSMALGPDGLLYVSSRFDGQVYRLTADGRAELYAADLGTATGLAFGRDGSLFVGDRAGTILRVSPERDVSTFASIPASIAAFHLAMGPDGCLFVAAPTLATHDALYRITPDRLVETLDVPFGRPQGLAFDATGALYVVDALAGAAGLYKLDVNGPGGSRELIATAPSLVGVAFDAAGGLVLASGDTLWQFESSGFSFHPGSVSRSRSR